MKKRSVNFGDIMTISLLKATLADCAEIQAMQKAAFAELYEKYKDTDTSPATEATDVIRRKLLQPQTEYYFILLKNVKVGVIRIVTLDESTKRISPIFILPEYQNKGCARQAMQLVEDKFQNTKIWLLDTIKQEPKLCCFYEKLGYTPTGKEEDIKDGMTISYYQKVKI